MSEPRLTERPLLTRARIGVLMGGQSAERDVSLRTGTAVHRSLVHRGYDAVAIDVGPTLAQDLREQKICLVFLALHGPGGEDGAIQGFLETLGIPYTGSGIQASAIGMHKITAKTLLASARIPVPAGTVVKRGEKASCATVMRATKLRWPVVVKPASQGSTIGVTESSWRHGWHRIHLRRPRPQGRHSSRRSRRFDRQREQHQRTRDRPDQDHRAVLDRRRSRGTRRRRHQLAEGHLAERQAAQRQALHRLIIRLIICLVNPSRQLPHDLAFDHLLCRL